MTKYELCLPVYISLKSSSLTSLPVYVLCLHACLVCYDVFFYPFFFIFESLPLRLLSLLSFDTLIDQTVLQAYKLQTMYVLWIHSKESDILLNKLCIDHIQHCKMLQIWIPFHRQNYSNSKWFSKFESTSSKSWLQFKCWRSMGRLYEIQIIAKTWITMTIVAQLITLLLTI